MYALPIFRQDFGHRNLFFGRSRAHVHAGQIKNIAKYKTLESVKLSFTRYTYPSKRLLLKGAVSAAD